MNPPEENTCWLSAMSRSIWFEPCGRAAAGYRPEAADQVERAASGIVLNLAEGVRRHGRDPPCFFDSAGEVRGVLAPTDAWGWQIESGPARALLDRELGLLRGLTRRGRSKPFRALGKIWQLRQSV
jgi:hypothetical protein